MRIARILCFSLACLLLTCGLPQTLEDKVSGAKSAGELQRILDSEAKKGDEIAKSTKVHPTAWKDTQDNVRRLDRIRRGVQGSPLADPPASTANQTPASKEEAAQRAKEILENPLYRDAKPQRIENKPIEPVDNSFWQTILDSIQQFLDRIFGNQAVSPGGGSGAGFVIPIVWGLIVAAVIVFAFFVAKYFGWDPRSRHSKNLSGMLDDEEENLTADEWLIKAGELEAAGKQREAVRCLYLACLARLNQAGILQFVRRETNWEHLSRFESMTSRPIEFDLRSATQLFDIVYYGHHIRESEDVSVMRDHYSHLISAIKVMPKSA